ncbi:MAG: hypothetical protein AAB970_01060 [Patescibacteria group bacterium]
MKNENEILIDEFFSNFVEVPQSKNSKYSIEAMECILFLNNFFMNPKTREVIKKLEETIKIFNRNSNSNSYNYSKDHC